jgi:hypothetical protein
MRLLGLSDRNKIPESAFLDPKNKLFPVQSQEQATEAAGLISKLSDAIGKPLKDRLSDLAKTGKWNLPAEFAEEEPPSEGALVADSVLFETGDDSYEDGDFVIYPQRKLFPAGWYESHNYGMTPEELAVAAYSAGDVPLDLDHHDTVIKDEYIGHGRNFTAAWEGDNWVKRGDIAIHKMLAPLLKDETKMSTTWDRESKSLTKIALLLNPRIPDAELKPAIKSFAAFATKAHTTNTGKTAIQNLHDQAVRSGAVCDSKNAGMVSKSENKAIQAVHDQMAAAGAVCEGPNKSIWSYYTDDSGNTAGEEESTMQVASTDAANKETPSPAAMNDAQNPQLVAMQKQIDAMAKQNRQKDARAAFTGLLHSKKITPGLQGHFEALFEQLSADDEKDSATIQFGEKDDQKASRAELLTALFGGITPHRHDEEFLKTKVGGTDSQGNVLFEGDEESSDSVRKRMAAKANKYASNGKAPVTK